MLKQIVYTRCKPYYDLEKDEKLINKDGYGYFNYSLDVSKVLQENEYKKTLKRMKIMNDSPNDIETPKYNSYEYLSFLNEKSAILFEYSRPFGKEEKRILTHVKQLFLGELEGYPSEFFGCSHWDAWKVPEGEYYRDSTSEVKEPPRAKLMDSKAVGGNVDYNVVRSFINKERKNVLKKVVWFILKEFNEPLEKRKVLLIKDHPDNVAKWIAAINYALSPEMARKISFNTNVAGLNGNIESMLFYKETPLDEYMIPHNMIVGYTTGEFKVFPISRFRVLNGEKNTFDIEVDASINRFYFDKILEYSIDTKDFCQEVLPGFGVKEINTDILDYYDAYAYLLEQSHAPQKWEYNKLRKYLSLLTENGKIKNKDFITYLVKEGLENYLQFFGEDLNKDFGLFNKYISLAKLINQEDKFLDFIANRMHRDLNELDRYGNELRKIWTTIKEAGLLPTFKLVLENLFNDTELVHYQKGLQEISSENVYTIYEIYLFSLDMRELRPVEIISDKVQLQFIYSCIFALLKDEVFLKKALQLISRKQEVYEKLLVVIPDNIVNNNMKKAEERWWSAVMQVSSGNMDKLFAILINSPKASFVNIENLLSQCIRASGKCDENIREAFSQSLRKLQKEQETGLLFFNTWLNHASQEEWKQIIASAKDLSVEIQCQIFRKLESMISLDKKLEETLFFSLKEWASQLKIYSKVILLAQLSVKLMKVRKENEIELLLEQFSAKGVFIESSLYKSNYFSQLVKKIAKFNGETLNLLFLICFAPKENSDIDTYIDVFTEEYLECSKSKNKVDEFLVLYDTAIMNNVNRFMCDKDYSQIQSVLKKKLNLTMPKYYKKNMVNMVEGSKVGSSEAKDIMIEVTEKHEKALKSISKKKGFSLSNLLDRFKEYK